MAKTVFRQGEVVLSTQRVVLAAPTSSQGPLAVVDTAKERALEAAEEYTGPTADDLRREAEAYKISWTKERETMINSAKAEADRIVREAEAAAFQEVKRKTDQALAVKQTSDDEAARILTEAKRQAAEVVAQAQKRTEETRKEDEKRGFENGREEGFAAGRVEAERLVERLHTILERAQGKRTEILAETEQQLVDLVLLITRKVVKVISENQRNVVISNVVQALRKIKGRGDITIRVNFDDLKLTTEHTKDFIRLIEGVKGITVMEDSTVDRGGCLVETEYGEIDARISSQLAELEQKILEMSPIRTKPRKEAAVGDES